MTVRTYLHSVCDSSEAMSAISLLDVEHWKTIDLAYHYLSLGDGERALNALQNASPELAESWLWRANAMNHLSRYHEAIESARRGLEIDPGNASLRNVLARAKFSLGDLAEAEREIVETLAQDPRESEALATYAAILSSGGKHDAAATANKRAAELAPEARSVRFMRAVVTEAWDDETAVRMSRELLEAEPEGAAEHWLHGMNLVRRGRLRTACDHFNRAAALDPSNATFTVAARVSGHWFFWPLRATSPVLFWLAWYSILPLWMYAASFGGILWPALWTAIGWSSYAGTYLIAHRYVARRVKR